MNMKKTFASAMTAAVLAFPMLTATVAMPAYAADDNFICGFEAADGTLYENTLDVSVVISDEGVMTVNVKNLYNYPSVSGRLYVGKIILNKDEAYIESPENAIDGILPVCKDHAYLEDGRTEIMLSILHEGSLPAGEIGKFKILPKDEDTSFSCSVFGKEYEVADKIRNAGNLPFDVLAKTQGVPVKVGLNFLGEDIFKDAPETAPTFAGVSVSSETEAPATAPVAAETTTVSETTSVPETTKDAPETAPVPVAEPAAPETETTAVQTDTVAVTTMVKEAPSTAPVTTNTETTSETTATTTQKTSAVPKEETSKFDVNGDGKVDWNDFAELISKLFSK